MMHPMRRLNSRSPKTTSNLGILMSNRNGLNRMASVSSSALKPGQELFAEDPFIVEVRRKQKAQREINLDFANGIIVVDFRIKQ